MRVISLVPSITETLIECGVNVVGRTRFCIHPQGKVDHIVKVGGTKGINWARCVELKPDLVIFDREENLKSMAEECPYPWVASHITSVDTIGNELLKLAAKLDNKSLEKLAHDWHGLAKLPNRIFSGWESIPGQQHPLNNQQAEYKRLEYIIWQKPWMAIGQDTFIASMLAKLGFAEFLPKHEKPYPVINADDMSRDDTFYLFSSEPYPFAREKQQLIEQNFNGAIVDGELYSWFGVRSYRGLLQQLTA